MSILQTRLILPHILKNYARNLYILSSASDYLLSGSKKVVEKGMGLIHGPTGEEVVKDVDLSGKTCLITGGSSGIGLEIVRCLIPRNCDIIMACRNPYSAILATRRLCGQRKQPLLYETNLASLASVKNFCDKIVKDHKNIDIVFLNAGVFGLPWILTEDRVETTFQVNFLSQYYILQRIQSILAPNARVVITSSESHRNVNWNMDYSLSPIEEMVSIPKNQYTSIKAYNVSKLCGILSMHYFGYRWLNTAKSIFCAHPGSFVKTNLSRNWWVYESLYVSMKPFSKTISHAAATPLYCAVSPELDGLTDMYFKNCEQCHESEFAKDLHLAFRITDLSEKIITDRLGKKETVEEAKHIDYEEQKTPDMVEGFMSNYS